MSISALAFLTVYASALILAFLRHPRWGLVAYLWAFYNNPPARWWDDQVPNLRWSLIAAVVTLVALIVHSANEGRHNAPPTMSAGFPRPSHPSATAASTDEDLPPWHSSWGVRLLVLFTAWLWLQTLWAVRPDFHMEGALLFTKYVLFSFAMYRILIRDRGLEYFAWAHVVGCFLWGWIGFTSELSGRFEHLLGPGVDDSNISGFHLTTGLAFAGFLFLSSRGINRWVAFATVPFILNGLILTASRSAMVGCVAAGFAALLMAPRARRWVTIGSAALGLVLLLLLARDVMFWDRMATIGVTQAGIVDERTLDKSAMSRWTIAAANWDMFLDYPLGAGHRGNEVISPAYVPTEMLTAALRHSGNAGDAVRSAHNTLLAILVDHGVPGATLFLMLIAWAVIALFRLRALDRVGAPVLLGAFRAATAAGLAAWFVSGQFVNLFKAEVVLWLLVVLMILEAHGIALRRAARRSEAAESNVRLPLPIATLSAHHRVGLAREGASFHVKC